MQIGRKIYFDKVTGNVLANTGEMCGDVRETTQEEDFQSYIALQERVRDTIGVIQLEYGELTDKFNTCTGFHVDTSKDVIDSEAIVFDFTPQQIAVQQEQITTEERLSAVEIALASVLGGAL